MTDAALPTLDRVVSLAGLSTTVDRGPITLVSLDVWTTMLVVRAAYPLVPGETVGLGWLSDRLATLWRIVDDQGTQYRQSGGAAGERSGLVIETRYFEPGLAPETTRLALNIEGHELTINL